MGTLYHTFDLRFPYKISLPLMENNLELIEIDKEEKSIILRRRKTAILKSNYIFYPTALILTVMKSRSNLVPDFFSLFK